jgi:hypothetical protein
VRKLLVIADDLAGACDTGAQFSGVAPFDFPFNALSVVFAAYCLREEYLAPPPSSLSCCDLVGMTTCCCSVAQPQFHPATPLCHVLFKPLG